MAKDNGPAVIRFSRRELALVYDAVEFMVLPDDPDDQRLVLELRELLEREVAQQRGATA